MRPSNAALLLLASFPLAFADVLFTVPAAGASIAGGTAFTVTWKDSGNAPSLADLSGYQLFLYTGSNSAPQQVYSMGNGAFTSGSSMSVTIPVGIGASVTNA